MNILIINGHPNPDSYCSALCKAYARGANKAGHNVSVLHLHELTFNLNLTGGYSKDTKLEADVIFSQEKISWANHIVVVHPVWWGSVPALLKGFFDRVLLPGFAFKYRKEGQLWDKLLSGKTASIIYTADTPVFIYRYLFLSPSVNMVKNRVLGFCGIKTKKVVCVAPIRKSTQEFRERWITRIEGLGQTDIR